mgnify:CR=1 FL=1
MLPFERRGELIEVESLLMAFMNGDQIDALAQGVAAPKTRALYEGEQARYVDSRQPRTLSPRTQESELALVTVLQL